MQTITVKLPEALVARLEALAEESERSKSYYIRKAIIEFLEDKEDIAIAEQRMDESRVSLKDLIRRNGLGD